MERGRERQLQDAARSRARGVVVGQVVRRQRRVGEIGSALVRFAEQRADARVDEIAGPFERRHVRRREAEAAGAIGHRPRPDRVLDRRRQRRELRVEALGRQVERVEMTLQIVRRRRRRLPRVMVGADLGGVRFVQGAQHVGRSRIPGHRPRHHVGRPDAVAAEALVQRRQRVEVLERRPLARGQRPLVVALGVDADEETELAFAFARSGFGATRPVI